MTRAALVCLVLACARPVFAQPAEPHVRLRKIIADQGCQTSGLSAAVANELVVSFGVLHDGNDCVIAFFRDLERDGAPLEVISSRGASRPWAYAKVPVAETDRGPVSAVQLEGGVILVLLDAPLDDFTIPILTSDLNYLATIHGTFVRTWPNGLLQYDSRRPDSGPHSAGISVFDPKTGTDREIYRFEAEILAPLYFDWQTNTFAFAIDARVQTMVTCDGLASIDSIKCRETPLKAWQTGRPDLSLTQLVTFAASQPRFR